MEFEQFIHKFNKFIELRDVPAENKKEFLLISLNEIFYTKLLDMCHPQSPKDKTFDELMELLKVMNVQYIGRKVVYRERVNFYKAKQERNESIALWYARVKTLSIDCKFADNCDSLLLDRFISGLCDSAALERLYEEDDNLTLHRAVEIATSRIILCKSTGKRQNQITEKCKKKLKKVQPNN